MVTETTRSGALSAADDDTELAVAVIDDHEIVAFGVETILQAHGVGARVYHAASAIKVPANVQAPAVAVLDLRLHDGSTPAQSIEILTRRGLPVVVYTSADDPVLVREAIAAGAMAIVRKSSPPVELVDTIRAAANGEPSAGLDWAAALDADRDFVAECLTPNETSILALYASGETAEQIARQLSFSVHTVNKAVARIREKYRSVGRKVESRIDLFHRAAEDGVVSYFGDTP